MAANRKNPNPSSSVLEDAGIQFVRCGHTVPLEKHIYKMRATLTQKEEELNSAQQELTVKTKEYEAQVMRLNNLLLQNQQETQALKARAQAGEQQHQASNRRTSDLPTALQFLSPSSWFGSAGPEPSSVLQQSQQEAQALKARLADVENYYRHELSKMNAALGEKAKEAEFFKHSLSERESYHQRKLDEARSVLQQKDEELKSFKDRVAGDVALSIKTGKTESMNNPVSKTRLKEMYEDLRLLWPTIKNRLKADHHNPESVKALLQTFQTASRDMEDQKGRVEAMFGLDETSNPATAQKVQEYRKATIQYLQLTLFHGRKDEAQAKISALQSEGGSVDVKDFLVSQVQWLGSLMALNDPPLRPDWENHDPGMNMWDILPRALSSSTAL